MKALFLFMILALSGSQMTWAQDDDSKAQGQSLDCTLADQSCFKNVNGGRLSDMPEHIVPLEINKFDGKGGAVAPVVTPAADPAKGAK